ncbi:imidazolonepropionase [Anaerosphaera multitolerans]|uniref:Imidazolonepropionase n=1 Tax=Anaerosphaera multitolerans TaxID=2487351 RepID=A0A437S9X5_9FIRM|nr:imidazolonepropionase [Anaerosphaera multitolerans]RVU55617.1 imidazolonepropionase [Anaerosphaera multitolerans]
MSYILLKNCRELLTVREDAKDLIGLLKNKSLLIEDENIKKIDDYENIIQDIGDEEYREIDCSDKVVMPGYVDSHTHLIFGKSRVDEYVASLTMNSEEVKKTVGRVGLASSIYSTKNATDEELVESSLIKLNRMLESGTTTVEIKSGYGIDKDVELRQLRLLNKVREKTPQTIFSTYLGAHYYDEKMGKEKYIDFMIKEVMPIVKEEKLAQFSDVWIDDGYYTAKEAEKILTAGMDFGMVPSMHTECYSAIGGVKLAVEIDAANAGHLNYLTLDDTKLLANSNVVGILIPGTDFSVKHPRPFNPRPMIEEGMKIAIATNLNPGNWVESMQFAMALACRNHGMTEKEALRAATLGGAQALRIDDKVGSLEEGKIADIQIVNSDSYKNCVYKLAVNEVESIIKNGEVIF